MALRCGSVALSKSAVSTASKVASATARVGVGDLAGAHEEDIGAAQILSSIVVSRRRTLEPWRRSLAILEKRESQARTITSRNDENERME